MAITLFTGVPGAGKTLRSIFEALKKKAEGRPVFHIGIDGMKPDIIPPSPVPLEEWKKLPPGSVLVVDEAHKYLPVRQPGRPPQWIQDITEIRHFGIELYLVSQDPRNIDAFVRRLIGEHRHMSRKAGLNGAMVRTFQGVSENPDDWNNRQSSQQEPWRYPKHLFQVYDSASLHVVKPKVPKKILFAIVLFLVCIVGIPYAIFKVKGIVSDLDDDPVKSALPASAPASSGKSSGSAFAFSGEDEISPWLSADAFIKAHQPLVPGIPISAPIYAGATPQNHPRMFCVIFDDKCSCYTEQATKLGSVPDSVCRSAVEHGFYDPYLPSREQAGSASADSAPASPSETSITEKPL